MHRKEQMMPKNLDGNKAMAKDLALAVKVFQDDEEDLRW